MFGRFSFAMPPFAWAEANEGFPDFLFHHSEHRDRHRRFGKRHCQGDDESFGRGWGEEGRRRRGDIKFILLELLSDRPSHGYDLIKEMESRHGGFRRLSPGSVYPTLQLLEEGGYLTSQEEEGKRIYTITEAGRKLLTERTHPHQSYADEGISDPIPELMELRNVASELIGLVRQIARSGKAERISRVREKLQRIKREIYALLAEE
jgi:DNA-binding PadR family transcriptional regulator